MKNRRRQFLKSAGAFAAGSLILPLGCSPKKSGGESTMDTAQETSRQVKDVGLQLYTLRNQIQEEGLEPVLKKVADIGFQWMEGFGYEGRKILGAAPADLKSILSDLGMSMPSIHSVTEVSSTGGKQAIMDQMKTTAEDVKAAGAKYLVWAFLQENERKSIDDYKRHIETWNQFGQVCKDTGLQFAYHNHWFEYEELEGQKPYDLILAETDPDLVKFELDLYWISKAGSDPIEYFNKAPGRYPMWHVKDMTGDDKKFFAPVGKGVIDFKKIFDARDVAGMKYFFVEQDQTAEGVSPYDAIKISFDYLQKASFV